ncbi:MAG: hypothetical protein Q4F47_09375 [Bacteroidaceae bacterium]|nr:hypothetical protein [Bacteroidaceae bacterium]
MKTKKFCGIFTAAFAIATVITLASCSQDDEYYEDGLFTRADEMMTRTEGNPGNDSNVRHYVIEKGEGNSYLTIGGSAVYLMYTFNFKWNGGPLGGVDATMSLVDSVNNSSVQCYYSNPDSLEYVDKYEIVSIVWDGNQVRCHDNFFRKAVQVKYKEKVIRNQRYMYTREHTDNCSVELDVSSYIKEE